MRSKKSGTETASEQYIPSKPRGRGPAEVQFIDGQYCVKTNAGVARFWAFHEALKYARKECRGRA